MGKSDRQKQAERFQSMAEGMNANVANPFHGYKPESSTQEILHSLDTATNKDISNVRSDAKTDLADTTTGLTKGLASRGMGGSILEDQALKAKGVIGKNSGSIIKDLMARNLAGRTGILSEGNQNKMNVARAGSSVDLANMANLFQKLGLLQGNIGNFSDTNTWDDILQSLSAAGTVAGGVAGFV